MEQFPHLKFIQKIIGKPRFHGGGASNPKTEENKQKRQTHSDGLGSKTDGIKANWSNTYVKRENLNLAPLNKEIVPIFLQINPDALVDVEFDLQNLGIEIISQEDDGYIIGASLDNLRTLEDKINGFANTEHGSGIIADLWEIIAGNRDTWKPKHILSDELYAKWSNIQDDHEYHLEVSVAFDKPIGKEPDPSKKGGTKRLEKYNQKLQFRDDQLLDRENHFDKFISHYGKITSSLIHLEDSFGCEVTISGKGLKDLVVNYQFVFEVIEVEEIGGTEGVNGEMSDFEVDIVAPDSNAPEVGVIDSGIMEGHKYISAAINSSNSKSYVNGDINTADLVQGGGHGTRVAGAILFPNGISHLTDSYQLVCFLRNLKVLDKDNLLLDKYPAELMEKIVTENEECNLFNLSISSKLPHRNKHMTTWAAMLDYLIHEYNILFITSVGNITKQNIKEYIQSGQDYPVYLKNKFCRLANPAQSSFSLAVGSVNHALFEDDSWKSLGAENDISAFSRIGTGIWGSIKPDVVEYGGGLVVTKNGTVQITEKTETSPELIRSTLHSGSAYGKDTIGTSFATPKVTNIAAQLKKLYPEENINLIRALVVQGARLPNHHFIEPSTESIQFFGYGLPSLERVTKNTDYRTTFYNTGKIKAEEGHIYSLKIPSALRNPGDSFDVLIEVTLAFSAKVRRTRQKTKSYLSTWLEWKTSKIGEKYDSFKDYVLKEIEEKETKYDQEARKELKNYSWKINNRSDLGVVDEVNRNNSSVQKDWAIVKSYDLPEEIGLGVLAHKGWDKNKEEVPYALTMSIEILGQNVPIYESIRIENGIEVESKNTEV